MVEIIHKPSKNFNNHYLISGDNIEEIIDIALMRIREKSKAFYRKHIEEDLKKKQESLIDIHAGLGNMYSIELIKQEDLNNAK